MAGTLVACDQLLCVSDELRLSRVVLLIRSKKGVGVTDRVAVLGRAELFHGLGERFARVVRAVEVDIAAAIDVQHTADCIRAAAGGAITI